VTAKKLTPKQEMFCLEYLIDLNATQAAARAGYSEATAKEQGCRLLTNVYIQERIAVLMAERAKVVKVDAAWVLQKSIELHDRCSQASPVKDREGNPILDDSGQPIYKFEHTGVSKALELIGKHINVQAFNEKQTSEVTHKVSDTLASKLFGGSKK
jgi:phage terminase small subunit